MDAPIHFISDLISRYTPLQISTRFAQSSATHKPEVSNNPKFTALCTNWAQKISKDKNISVAEAHVFISKLMKEKTADEQKKIALAHALHSKNWENDPVFSNTEEYPYYALACLQEGSITIEQFSTLMFYRTCVLYHESKDALKAVPLFIVDPKTNLPVVNPFARDIVKQTCAPRNVYTTSGTVLEQTVPQLTESQIDDFFKKMSEKSPSEQQFFIMPDTFRASKVQKNQRFKSDVRIPQEMIEKVAKEKNVSIDQAKEIAALLQDKANENLQSTFSTSQEKFNRPIIESFYEDQGFNPLNFFEEEGKRKRMMPSFSMMQTFIDVKHLKPVTLNPVLGVSPVTAIHQNAINRTRELALPFVDFPLPPTADEKDAPGFDFIYHDFYHANVFAYIPQAHVECILKIIQLLEEIKSTKDSNSPVDIIDGIIEELYDLEGAPYQVNLSNTNPESIKYQFWHHLWNVVESFRTKRAIRQNSENLQQDLQEMAQTQAASNFYSKLTKALIQNAEFFKSRGIDFKELHEVAAAKKEVLKNQLCDIALNSIEGLNLMDMLSGGAYRKQILMNIEPKLPELYQLDFIIWLSEQMSKNP